LHIFHCITPRDEMQERKQDLQVCVQNTFLHVRDANEQGLARSSSSPSLSSASQSDSSAGRPVMVGTNEHHFVYPSSTGSDTIGFHCDASSDECANAPIVRVDEGNTQIGQENEPCAASARGPSMSAGAELHSTGECSPCGWHWREGGCCHGAACKFCHMCGPGAIERRRRVMRKAKKEHYKPAATTASDEAASSVVDVQGLEEAEQAEEPAGSAGDKAQAKTNPRVSL